MNPAVLRSNFNFQENASVKRINFKVMRTRIQVRIINQFHMLSISDYAFFSGAKPFGCKYEFCQFRSGDLSAVSKHQKKCSHNPANML